MTPLEIVRSLALPLLIIGVSCGLVSWSKKRFSLEKAMSFFVTATLTFIIILGFVGAIVRATGAGLGCPDWPTCWGQLIPPWKVEQVDLEKIDYERFERKAERLGRDPSTVTREHILESFNPVHTWTEFVNRLTSLPVGFFSLCAVIAAFHFSPPRRKSMLILSWSALLIILINAVMGAMVVYSGLKPGIITLHLALAMGLICLLVYCRRLLSSRPAFEKGRRLAPLVWGLLALVMIEGILGTQVRELTDVLARSHQGEERAAWIGTLERSVVYLVHRSFSWLIVVFMAVVYYRAYQNGIVEKRAQVMAVLVILMMVMGLILAQVGVYAWVQILHVGVASIMVTVLCDWGLVLQKAEN